MLICLFFKTDSPRYMSCLFSNMDTINWSSFKKYTANLYINHFVSMPVYLKYLATKGYGPVVANKLIEALDKYSELIITLGAVVGPRKW